MSRRGPITLMMMTTKICHSLPKIPKYDRRRDFAKQLNSLKTHMSLRGATPVLKCRAFHLNLSGAIEMWYTRLLTENIQSWLDFKKAFLK